jgi:CBS domain-containing protein
MRVSDVMTSDVKIMSPDQTIKQAATMMKKLDIGLLPIGENDRLVGMISDRDIALRGVAAGKAPDAKVRDVMTKDVRYCFEDEDTDEICERMAECQVRRLPVLNRDKRLVGIVSLGDISRLTSEAGKALAGISRPGGEHTQKSHAQKH